jgi:hypothetical protein
MIKQITVFLENTEGRLAALTHTLRRANVNMHALTISETSDYGLVRIICDDPDAALAALRAEDFRATETNVSAIEVPNRPGGLDDLLDALASLNMNIEYGYCFSSKGDKAVDVFKISGHAHTAEATFKLEEAGFKALRQEDLA